MQPDRHTPYRKLSGAVWLGPDHLLYLRRQLFSERPKRFAYADIQAITLRQTSVFSRVQKALLIVTALFCGVTAMSAVAVGPGWFLLVPAFPALLALAALLAHRHRGPTCVLHIRTAVQVEELQTLRRLRRARPAFDLLSQEAARAQGVEDRAAFAPESGPSPLREWATAPFDTDVSRPVLERREHQRRDYNGSAHALLFASLLLSAVISAVALVKLDWMVLSVAFLNLMVTLGCLVAALVMQHARNVSRELRIMGWVCTVYAALSNMVSSFTAPAGVGAALLSRGEINVWAYPTFLADVIVTMVLEVILAMFGFYVLAQFRHRQRRERETTPAGGLEPPPLTDAVRETAEEEQS